MPRSPSGASARPSPRVLIKSLERNALHTSRIRDMVRLNGNRSNSGADAVVSHIAERHQFPVGLTMNVARSDLSDYLGLSSRYPSGTDQCTHFERLWHLGRILCLPLRLSKRIGTWTGLNQR